MDWRVFTSLTEKARGYPKRGDAMCGLLPVPGDRVGCADPCPPGRPWSGPGPLPVRGEDWLALAFPVVAESFDGVALVRAPYPRVAGLGLPACGIFGIELSQDDVASSYPSAVDDLDSVGEFHRVSLSLSSIVSWWGKST